MNDNVPYVGIENAGRRDAEGKWFEMLWSFVIFAVGLLGFDFLAARFGVNSQDGEDWVEREA